MTVAAWITPDSLPAPLPAIPGGEEAWAGVCELSSTVLFGLSGRRWAGVHTRTIEILADRAPWWWRDAAMGLPWGNFETTSGGGWGLPALPLIVGGEIYNVTGDDRRPIRLPDFPVREVTAVRVAGQALDPASYRLIGNRNLERVDPAGWGSCGLGGGVLMEVDYSWGSAPPPSAITSAVRLAVELGKAVSGQPSALPGYLMQRDRQGIREAYVRADSLFDKGRTGLPEVDLWLATVNPARLARRARSWSPDTDPHFRTLTSGGNP